MEVRVRCASANRREVPLVAVHQSNGLTSMTPLADGLRFQFRDSLPIIPDNIDRLSVQCLLPHCTIYPSLDWLQVHRCDEYPSAYEVRPLSWTGRVQVACVLADLDPAWHYDLDCAQEKQIQAFCYRPQANQQSLSGFPAAESQMDWRRESFVRHKIVRREDQPVLRLVEFLRTLTC